MPCRAVWVDSYKCKHFISMVIMLCPILSASMSWKKLLPASFRGLFGWIWKCLLVLFSESILCSVASQFMLKERYTDRRFFFYKLKTYSTDWSKPTLWSLWNCDALFPTPYSLAHKQTLVLEAGNSAFVLLYACLALRYGCAWLKDLFAVEPECLFASMSIVAYWDKVGDL